MKQSSVKEIAIPAVMLFVIALVCTALLAGTNLLTKDAIAERNVQAQLEAKKAVFSEAQSFSDEKTVKVDGENAVYFEALDKENKVIGYVFSESTKSYGGDLSCMVGVSASTAKITGVEITAINDTPGLGMKAKGKDWLKQFNDRTGTIGVNKNESTDTEIKAISGATITSNAVTGAVNHAFSAYEQIKAGGNNG